MRLTSFWVVSGLPTVRFSFFFGGSEPFEALCSWGINQLSARN